MPATAWTDALSPSEIFIVTVLPTTVVSLASRFTNSPVLFLSKKAISCRMIDPKRFVLILLTMRFAVEKRIRYSDVVIIKIISN